MLFAGFESDAGDWPKCGQHGVCREEIEPVLSGSPSMMADPHPDEPRMRATGKTAAAIFSAAAISCPANCRKSKCSCA